MRGREKKRDATAMNMQWGLISAPVLPWRMALSLDWCSLNMNFITTHLSWLVMDFFTVLSTGSHTFHHYYLRIPFFYDYFIWYRFPSPKEKALITRNTLAFADWLAFPKWKNPCKICRWASFHFLVDKSSCCHKYRRSLEALSVDSAERLELNEHGDNCLLIPGRCDGFISSVALGLD